MSLQKTVAQADIDSNPIITELQGQIGDTIAVYHPDAEVKLVPEINETPAPVEPTPAPVDTTTTDTTASTDTPTA